MSCKFSIPALGAVVLTFFSAALLAAPRASQARFTALGPIVVDVRRAHDKLEYKLDDRRYSSRDLNFLLAEKNLDGVPQRRVFAMMDSTTHLDDIKLVTKMALDAGFTHIQVYVVWQDSGNMAELVFGPVKKISQNPDGYRRAARQDP
jgi:hypothetical protein